MKRLSALFSLLMFVSTCFASTLQESIDSLVASKNAKIGVAVKYGNDLICEVNADEHFPMMSVYKLHQAIAVLDSIGKSRISLDTTVRVTKENLKPNTYSPLRDKYPNGNFNISIVDLLRYSLLQSDNNACDILFSIFNGTEYVDKLMHRYGLENTQIRWNEDELHADENRVFDNYTTPKDAVKAIEIAFGNSQLKSYIASCQTGANRLPALLPKDITIGHKTGTWGTLPNGITMGINDIGYISLPDGRHYFIAVFCNESHLSMAETEKIIAEISQLVYNFINTTNYGKL